MQVFCNTATLEFYLVQSASDVQICRNAAQWHRLPGPKVLCFETQEFGQQTLSEIQSLMTGCDQVFLFLPEFIDDSWCRLLDLANVTFFIAGALNYQLTSATTVFLPYFFHSTVAAYQDKLPSLERDVRGADLDFDILLGRRKPHRDLLFSWADPRRDWVTYFPDHNDQDLRLYTSSAFVWPDDLVVPSQCINQTADEVIYEGKIRSLSQIIPQNIYRQTKYSIVAETCTSNHWSFFTEKIVKPMLCKRVFLVSAGQYYLANLRDLGFRTFGHIIDESYDHEPNPHTRNQMMWQQAQYLRTLDAEAVYESADAVLLHNQQNLTQCQWENRIIHHLAKLLG